MLRWLAVLRLLYSAFQPSAARGPQMARYTGANAYLRAISGRSGSPSNLNIQGVVRRRSMDGLRRANRGRHYLDPDTSGRSTGGFKSTTIAPPKNRPCPSAHLTGHTPAAGSNPLVVCDSTLACRAVARVHHTLRFDKQQLNFSVCTGLVLDALRNYSQLSGT